MGKRFFYKTIQLAAFFLVLALQAGAVEKPCPETAGKKKVPASQLTATTKPCSEADLTANAQPSSHYSQQEQKKVSQQLWMNALKTADSIVRNYSIIRRGKKTADSEHLEHIFSSHYFW